MTNPITLSLVSQVRFLYPMSKTEQLKFGFLAGFSALVEIGSTFADTFTDTKVSIKSLVDETCYASDIANFLNATTGKVDEDIKIDNTTYCSISECTLSTSLIPYFPYLSLVVTILPWILGLGIIFSHKEKFWEVWGRGKREKANLIEKCLFFICLFFFPVTVFLALAYFQYKYKYMSRVKNPGERQKLRNCEENLRFLAQEGCIAAKAVEVATESSLGPFIQLFALIPTCGFFNQLRSPWDMGFSDLSFSIVVSVICFAWSMTHSHVSKDGSLDLREDVKIKTGKIWGHCPRGVHKKLSFPIFFS